MDRAAVSIVGKIGQVLVDELQDIRGVGNKVIQLRDELATMNAVLHVISEADQGSVDHIVREWEKQVHDLVYDAEDCTDTYSLCISRPMARPSIYARAKRVARYPYKKLVLQRALVADIKDLLVRTTTVSERRARYNIDRATLPRSAFLAPVSAASISANALRRADDPDQFVGIMEQANVLVRKIKAVKVLVHDEYGKIKAPVHDEDDRINAPVHDEDDQIKASVHDQHDKIEAAVEDEDDKRLKVFYIVGFGGLGKTTLAMELCRQLEADFPCQAQVSVSQAFDVQKDMKGLLVRVLQQILKEKVDDKAKEAVGQIDKMNAEELSRKIQELLRHKRYLIVIDDVWSLQAWQAIHNRLPKNNCASRIIVTTRTEAVVKTASVYFVHHMESLKQEASKELFMMRVFSSTKEGTCPNELQIFRDTILDKCGGLPLAIISMASLLANYSSVRDIDMWERVSRSIGSHMESHPTLEGMRQLITLSYDYLPHHLKACMMYLSIFPEDHVVAKDRLLYRWIAEGLVTEKRGLTLLEVAQEYFNDLISRNMIQLDKFVSRGVEVEGCRVHDMILEVMVSKSQEFNFISLAGRQYGGTAHRQGKVRRLSIHDNHHDGHRPKKVEQHHARHGFEAMKLQHVRSLSTFQRNYGLSKLLDRLGEFKLLRVLDLEDCKALRNEHMRDVCRLYLLRFLSLRGTDVWQMPSKVGNLEHLETLDIKNTDIWNVPHTVKKLSKLQRLSCNCWILPRGIGNMKALCELDTAILKDEDVKVAQEIGELTQLRVLFIKIRSIPEPKEEFRNALASSLSKTSALRSLHLGCHASSLEFLHDVSPPPLLQCLTLDGEISQLPDWISALTHLTKFEVGRAKHASNQLFGVLCKLPNLQSIKLFAIKWKDRELVARLEHSFRVLRILQVWPCPTVLTFAKGSMTKLETLLLRFYNEKTRIVGLENLESLKEVKLGGPKGNRAVQRAVEQLKALSTESNQIKVVASTLFLFPKARVPSQPLGQEMNHGSC